MPPRRTTRPRSPEHAALGAAIQQMRMAAGFSQEALAEASDVHLTHIGGMERGVRNPSYATLLRVANALDSQVGELTTLADSIRSEAGSSHPHSALSGGALEDSDSPPM